MIKLLRYFRDPPPNNVRLIDFAIICASFGMILILVAYGEIGVGKYVAALSNYGAILFLFVASQCAIAGFTTYRSYPRGLITLCGTKLILVCGIVSLSIIFAIWLSHRARTQRDFIADRSACEMNLGFIYIAIVKYTSTHQNNSPKDLVELANSMNEPSDRVSLVCPSRLNFAEEREKVAGKSFLTERDQEFMSYTLIKSNHLLRFSAEEVLVIESLTNHQKGGVNILFGDGHVKWFNVSAARELFQRLEIQNHQ